MDAKIRLIAESETSAARKEFNELLDITNNLVKATDSLRQAMETKSNRAKKNTEEEVGLINNLRKSIDELTRSRDKSLNQSEIASYNQKIKEQNEELKKLTTTQEKANSLTDQQNDKVGKLSANTEKSTSMFSSLGKTLLAVFAVDKIIDYSKQLITLMGDTDKYRIALMNVSTSQKEYEKSLTFISKLSNDYGQNVNLLTQSYTSFIASSKSSNLTLDQRQKIYESIIKSGSALKLSNEGIEGSLRAVSQMFSKGNVSAEELRGQLGERLPGAFGIMAKAIGVTEPQLNKMLENGEVMAKDVLPKFAEELEKLYGDKAQSNLKTIGGAWNVFVNNFIEGLQDFNKSSLFIETISGWILSAANSLKVFIGWIKEAFTIGTKYNEVLNKWFDYYEVLYTAISNIVGAGWDLIKSLGQIISNILGAGDATLTFKKIVDYMIIAIKTLGSALIGAVTILQVMADAFNIALNYGKRFANFFGADFKIDPKATFTNLADNAKTNFNRITSLWNESSSKVLGTAKATNKAIIDDSDKTTKELEKDLNQQGLNDKKANDKKLSNDKELNKKLKAEREAFQQKITDIENKGEEERAFERSKHANKIYPIYSQSYDKVQKVLESFNVVAKTSGDKFSKEMADRITKDSGKIEEIIKKSNEFYEQLKKNIEDDEFVERLWNQIKKQEEEKKRLIIELKRQLGSEMINLMNQLLDKSIEHYQKEVDAADGAMKKFFAQQKLNSAKNTADVISGAMDIASGDYVKGSIKIITGIVKFFDQEFNAYARALEARAVATAESIKRNLDTLLPRLQATISGLEGIESIYKKVGEDPFKEVTDSLLKLNQMYSTLLDNHLSGIDKMTERANNSALALVDAEIAIGEQIISNWNSAVNKQNDIYTKQKSNQEEIYSTLKSKAQEQFDKDISDINSKYDLEVAKINAKYDLISVKNSQRFDAESLAIAEAVNNDLMAFVQNQDLKIGLTTEYERRKNEIATTFALAYKPITEGMTEAEIKGINDAKKARDEAFAKLAEWQTGQIKFVIDNGKLEIDTFTDVQKVISKGKDDQYQLGLKYKNQEIQDDINKGIELDAIEKQRDSDVLTRTTAHKANLELIETNHKAAMKLIEENHVATITALNLAKDEAIAASMGRLKDFMITAIGDMQNRYAEMVAKGIEGSEAMLESLNKLKDAYYNLYNTPLPGSDNSRGSNTSPTPTTNPIPTNTPRFKDGTELVGGIQGVDRNLAWLSHDEAVIKGETNRKKLQAGLTNERAIQYAINYKSILDGGFSPLALKDNILPKLEERAAMQYLLNMNTQPIIDELKEVKQTLSKLPLQKFVFDKDGVNQYEQTKNSVKMYRKKRFE